MIGEGVLYRRTPEKIKISIRANLDEHSLDFEDMKVNVVLKWNEVTYRRYFQILEHLENVKEDIPFLRVFFTNAAKGYKVHDLPVPLGCYPSMNELQN
jgi:hypothetical protein